MRSHFRPSLVVLALLVAGTTLAAPVEPFREGEEAAAQAARQNVSDGRGLNRYQSDDETPPAPVPWRALGLLGLVLTAVAPFAIKSYRQTAGEVSGGSRRR